MMNAKKGAYTEQNGAALSIVSLDKAVDGLLKTRIQFNQKFDQSLMETSLSCTQSLGPQNARAEDVKDADLAPL
ncbi:hypothetical protein ACI77O_13595 [Pseudomonas tritici]|uniref:hypothetical protein n=1 Tax=Pseudomonas tritici TaxID=2745518 RepID=UPI00387B7CC7